jgi:hypothetical protein
LFLITPIVRGITHADHNTEFRKSEEVISYKIHRTLIKTGTQTPAITSEFQVSISYPLAIQIQNLTGSFPISIIRSVASKFLGVK